MFSPSRLKGTFSVVLVTALLLSLIAVKGGIGVSEERGISYEFLDAQTYQLYRGLEMSRGSRSAMFTIIPISVYGDELVIVLSGWIFSPFDRGGKEVTVVLKELRDGTMKEIPVSLIRRGGYLYLKPLLLRLPRGRYLLKGLPGAELYLPRDLFYSHSPLVTDYRGSLTVLKVMALKGAFSSGKPLQDDDLSDELNSRRELVLIVPSGVIEEIYIEGDEIRLSLGTSAEGQRRVGPRAIYLGRLAPGSYKLVLFSDKGEERSEFKVAP